MLEQKIPMDQDQCSGIRVGDNAGVPGEVGMEMQTKARMGLQWWGRASSLQSKGSWGCFLAQALKPHWVVIICVRFKQCNKCFSLLMPDCRQLQLKSPMDWCVMRTQTAQEGMLGVAGGGGCMLLSHPGIIRPLLSGDLALKIMQVWFVWFLQSQQPVLHGMYGATPA